MLWLFACVAIGADVPKHLAETVYEAEVADARKEFDRKIAEAEKKLKERLEQASKDAAKKGDVDKAVVYRDRAKAVPAAPEEIKPPLLGRYEFKWINGTSYDLIFQADESVTAGDEKNVKVFWQKNG